MDKRLTELAHEVEGALALDADLAGRVNAALEKVAGRALSGVNLESTDEVLGLVYEIRPGWSVGMKGTARLPNGHWRCTLRQSDMRDNDASLGVGGGPNLPHALLAALLKAVSQET